jgi:hypothetical protein
MPDVLNMTVLFAIFLPSKSSSKGYLPFPFFYREVVMK